MQRINTFLGEEEVPEWASSLKRSFIPPDPSRHNAPVEEKIGYENATLEWHRASIQAKGTKENERTTTTAAEHVEQEERVIETEERHPLLDNGQDIRQSPDTSGVGLVQEEASYLHRSESAVDPATLRKVQPFKLQNISVLLPPGKLTLVTGITGAGKTAFLVGLLGGE